MAFEVIGDLGGERLRVSWDAGKLVGDFEAVERLTWAAELLEGEAVGPIGQQTTIRHLSSGLSTLMLALEVFQRVELIGEIPEPAEVPDDAVI